MKAPRWMKIGLAAYAITLALALLIYLGLLVVAGPLKAERTWNPLFLTIIFVLALPFAIRYLK